MKSVAALGSFQECFRVRVQTDMGSSTSPFARTPDWFLARARHGAHGCTAPAPDLHTHGHLKT